VFLRKYLGTRGNRRVVSLMREACLDMGCRWWGSHC